MREVASGPFHPHAYPNGWVLQTVQYCTDIRSDHQRLLLAYEDDGSSSGGSCYSVTAYWFAVQRVFWCYRRANLRKFVVRAFGVSSHYIMVRSQVGGKGANVLHG